MSIELKELVTITEEPALLSQIQAFEQEYKVVIPDQYKQLLLLSDGVEISGEFPHPQIEGWDVMIIPYLKSLSGVNNTFLLFEELAQMGLKFQHQDKIIEIGGTQEGIHILMGWAGDINGKIFINELDDMTVENEIPLYLVADSLVSFLRMLK